MIVFKSKLEIIGYENILRPFALNLTRSREEAEDLIQDTFFRALANREKFADGTNLKAWLYTIMRNIFINNYRKKKKVQIINETEENKHMLSHFYKTEKNGAEGIFIQEAIANAMLEMSEDITAPFMMYNNGFKYMEIAEKLDLPLGTVKSRIFLARKQFQSKLIKMGFINSTSGI
jgi:RNA polymerase sigma-70 factor (ECF subfamily)